VHLINRNKSLKAKLFLLATFSTNDRIANIRAAQGYVTYFWAKQVKLSPGGVGRHWAHLRSFGPFNPSPASGKSIDALGELLKIPVRDVSQQTDQLKGYDVKDLILTSK